jgi:hypothetical protein
MSCCYGVCRCSRLVIGSAMHAIAGESKAMTSRDRPSSAILSYRWCIYKESLLELLFFRGVQRRSRRGFIA